MQAMVPHYLEASMEAFRRNQEQARKSMLDVMGGTGNPFEALTRQNMAMMKAAAGMWNTAAHGETLKAEGGTSDDVRTLKEEMKALQAKIDRLSKD